MIIVFYIRIKKVVAFLISCSTQHFHSVLCIHIFLCIDVIQKILRADGLPWWVSGKESA